MLIEPASAGVGIAVPSITFASGFYNGRCGQPKWVVSQMCDWHKENVKYKSDLQLT